MSYGPGGNPYDSPRNTGDFGSPGSPDPMIQSKVKGPAIALLVTAILGVLLCLYALAMNLTGAAAAQQQQQMKQMQGLDPQMKQWIETMNAAQGTFGLVQAGIGIVASGVILFGSLKMMKLESYGLAMTATILAMIPCVSPCCILGLPFGIWSLVVLMNADVKAAFH